MCRVLAWPPGLACQLMSLGLGAGCTMNCDLFSDSAVTRDAASDAAACDGGATRAQQSTPKPCRHVLHGRGLTSIA